MIFSVTTYYTSPVVKSDNRPLPMPPENEGKQICVMLGTAVIGLLVLSTFLSSGGLCATLAPWAMLAGLRADAHKPGWRWWSGISGAMFFCIGLAALLTPALGITSTIGGLLGLLCGLKYLVPLCLVVFRSPYVRVTRKGGSVIQTFRSVAGLLRGSRVHLSRA